MKAYLKHFVQGYSGTMDDCVMYFHKKAGVCVVRSIPHYKPNTRTQRMKNVMENLSKINPSEDYKNNFRCYLLHYNDLPENEYKQVITWSNLYLKMLYRMAKQMPEVDLLTLSREQIINQALPCRTLTAAIEAGILPLVLGYERYNNPI
jgi:hypothetical protein